MSIFPRVSPSPPITLRTLGRVLATCLFLAPSPTGVLAQSPRPPAAPARLTAKEARAIVEALRAAPELAAAPDLGPAADLLASPNPEVAARADAALSEAIQALAEAEHGRLKSPRSVDPDWALRATYDAAADFRAARASGQVAAWAAALPRRSPAYLALVAARRRYADIVAAGGWTPLPTGPVLRSGKSDARVPALRTRLAQEGYAAPAASNRSKPDVYEPSLAAVVGEFQRRHGLKADGVLTDGTVAALNVPAEDRLAALDANLERARWLPDQLPADRIEVDVAAAQAAVFQSGAPALSMRVIVGDPKHHTPIFVSKVVGVVFNPPWVVPASIATAELYPKEQRAPGYLARNGFSVVNGQLIQAPGPKASLGYVKIDIVSPFGVYLHDTPARSLFNRDGRALSHGCMRLEQPRELAVALLAPKGWTLQSVDKAIAAGTTSRVTPNTQTPVYVVYRTAEAGGDAGPVVFRPDVYGWDAKLNEAIGRR